MSTALEDSQSDDAGEAAVESATAGLGFPPEEDLHTVDHHLAVRDPFGDSSGPSPFIAHDDEDDLYWERHQGTW
jgi:hypothetical protein